MSDGSEQITDTDRVDFLIANGYCPAEWRMATLGELRMGVPHKDGKILVHWGNRETIDAIITRRRAEARKTRPTNFQPQPNTQ